mmetsp:Transcript_45976/g.73657  ORF Transcript_45976/g.73657 Transcript_45976/m.73657 type:complete len:209 (-) Transcript_45976:144-770(-)
MLLVVRIEFVCIQYPLIRRKQSTRLQYAVNLVIDIATIRRVAGGFDGEYFVECIVCECRQFAKVALFQQTLLCQTFLFVQLVASVHLILIDGHTHDLGTGECGNIPHGTSYAAADIQHIIGGFDVEFQREVVFMSDDRFSEGLTTTSWRKMEGLTPSRLIEIRGNVVKAIDEFLSVALAKIDIFVSFVVHFLHEFRFVVDVLGIKHIG